MRLEKNKNTRLQRWRQSSQASAKHIAWGVLCFYVAGCGPKREEVIQREVALRVAEFRKKKALDCQSALFSEAERTVDSLLLSEAKASLFDSLLRARPTKPLKPAAIPPVDSSVVKPIFNEPKDGEK